jgi:hypothetical protein
VVTCFINSEVLTIPWLRRSVTGLSPRRPGFSPGSVCVGFVVDRVAVRQVFLRVLRVSFVSIVPPRLHTHSLRYLGMKNRRVGGHSSET